MRTHDADTAHPSATRAPLEEMSEVGQTGKRSSTKHRHKANNTADPACLDQAVLTLESHVAARGPTDAAHAGKEAPARPRVESIAAQPDEQHRSKKRKRHRQHGQAPDSRLAGSPAPASSCVQDQSPGKHASEASGPAETILREHADCELAQRASSNAMQHRMPDAAGNSDNKEKKGRKHKRRHEKVATLFDNKHISAEPPSTDAGTPAASKKQKAKKHKLKDAHGAVGVDVRAASPEPANITQAALAACTDAAGTQDGGAGGDAAQLQLDKYVTNAVLSCFNTSTSAVTHARHAWDDEVVALRASALPACG